MSLHCGVTGVTKHLCVDERYSTTISSFFIYDRNNTMNIT